MWLINLEFKSLNALLLFQDEEAEAVVVAEAVGVDEVGVDQAEVGVVLPGGNHYSYYITGIINIMSCFSSLLYIKVALMLACYKNSTCFSMIKTNYRGLI